MTSLQSSDFAPGSSGHSRGMSDSSMTASGSGAGGSYHHQQASTSSAGSALQETPGRRNSVVIKVGMVGDAQIGKTSLMVKYVEGSFDEDYIQTLGMVTVVRLWLQLIAYIYTLTRCQLHGKDHFNSQHRNHILHLGSWWSARVRQHASASM